MAREPRRHLSRLRGIEAYSFRVGDYRTIVDVDWDQRVVYVLTLGHRSTVYR